jgi:hypothetical protein
LPKFFDESLNGTFTPDPADLDKLMQRALRSMLPGIKAELSLINSLYELKDFHSLPKTMKKIENVIFYFDRTIKRLGKTFSRGRTLRQILNTAADGYLQYAFNLSPLCSDLNAVHRAIDGTSRKVNDLVTREGKPQSKHFVYTWQEYEDKDEVSDGYLPIDPRFVPRQVDSAFQMLRSVRSYPTVFHAEVEYNYNFTQYQREHAQMLGLLDALGVNLNPRIIWNAIPWSFVIDWVVDVNQWLDQFKLPNLEPQINMLNFLWSVKRHRIIYTKAKAFSIADGYPSYPYEVTLPAVDETSYKRHVEGLSTSSLTTSGLSLSEFTLGAALITAHKTR